MGRNSRRDPTAVGPRVRESGRLREIFGRGMTTPMGGTGGAERESLGDSGRSYILNVCFRLPLQPVDATQTKTAGFGPPFAQFDYRQHTMMAAV